MKKILLYILIAFSSTAIAQNQVKIMTFNIHAASDATIEKIAEFIKSEKPDIVALQEVDFYTDRSKVSHIRPNNNNEDMLTDLAYRTGLQGMFFPAIDVYGGKYGVAVLSRFGFESTQSFQLAYEDNTEQRVAAICSIELPSKRIIDVICAHLDMADQDNGLNQIKELNEIAGKAKNPVLLGGDLNKRVGTTHIEELTKVWKLAVSKEFDHIAHYPNNSWNIIDTKIYEDNTLSDHLPLMVTYELK